MPALRSTKSTNKFNRNCFSLKRLRLKSRSKLEKVEKRKGKEMAKFTVPKESLKGLPPLPPGIYEVRLDGFKPKLSKQKPGKDQSVNLNPQLKVINHPTLNDRMVSESLNVIMARNQRDFCHAFGFLMDHEDDNDPQEASLPGEFQGDPNNLETMHYVGPLVGQIAKIELASVPGDNGRTYTNIKRYFCRVPNCTVSHPDSIL